MPATPDLMQRGLATKLVPWALAAAWLLCASAAQALAVPAGPTGLLNDTGQTLCDNGSNVMVACTSANTGDASTMPRQDGRFGRDAASPTKVGGGVAGFDFTKICWAGAVEGTTADVGKGTCTGTLVRNGSATASGTPATDWACTKDNVTNLIWSLQTQSASWDVATGSSYPYAGHNSPNRCGFNTDWRLPTRRELLSIVNRDGSNPTIDSNYFPSTQSNYYWTNDTYALLLNNAWIVHFSYGNTNADGSTKPHYVRLVRSGQ